MRRKLIIFFVIVLLGLSVIVTVHNDNVEEKDGVIMEFPWNKFRYADDVGFVSIAEYDSTVSWVGGWLPVFIPDTVAFDPNITDMVLVHSKEEAEGFPDNVFVAWPKNEEFAQNTIDWIHWAVNRSHAELNSPRREGRRSTELTLEEFGLEYPLTITDLVENWEKVDALLNRFDNHEFHLIRRNTFIGEPPPVAQSTPTNSP